MVDGAQEENQSFPIFRDVPNPKSWETLSGIGSYGPVVVLIPESSTGDTFTVVFLRETCLCFALPMTLRKLQRLHQALQTSVGTRGGQPFDLEDDSANCDTDCPTPEGHQTGSARSLRKDPLGRDGVHTILEFLWKDIAHPVLNRIMDCEPIPGATLNSVSNEKPMKPVSDGVD